MWNLEEAWKKSVLLLSFGSVLLATGCQADTTLNFRLNQAISSQNFELCQAQFSNTYLAQRVCKNWLKLAQLGEIEITTAEDLRDSKKENSSSRKSASNTYGSETENYYFRTKYTGDEGFFREKIQLQIKAGKIQEINTPASYWLEDLEISKIGADILLNASPKWITAWNQVREYYQLEPWNKLKQPAITLIFPRTLAAFQELTAVSQSADFGASTIPSQDGKTWRIVVNPLAENSDLTAAKALLAHEFAHILLAPYDKNKDLATIEGIAEFQSWQISPNYQLAAQRRLTKNRQGSENNALDEIPQSQDFSQRPRWAYDQSAALVARQVQAKGLDRILAEYRIGHFSVSKKK